MYKESESDQSENVSVGFLSPSQVSPSNINEQQTHFEHQFLCNFEINDIDIATEREASNFASMVSDKDLVRYNTTTESAEPTIIETRMVSKSLAFKS